LSRLSFSVGEYVRIHEEEAAKRRILGRFMDLIGMSGWHENAPKTLENLPKSGEIA